MKTNQSTKTEKQSTKSTKTPIYVVEYYDTSRTRCTVRRKTFHSLSFAEEFIWEKLCPRDIFLVSSSPKWHIYSIVDEEHDLVGTLAIAEGGELL